MVLMKVVDQFYNQEFFISCDLILFSQAISMLSRR